MLPFIIVIPFLIINDLFLIIAVICFTLLFSIIVKIHIWKVVLKVLSIVPFIVIITVFLPFYIGSTVFFQFQIIIPITIYLEGLQQAILLFMRILGATYVFMSFFSTLTYSEFIEAMILIRIPPIFIGSLVIMLHYIPILAHSNKTILNAQELRGKKVTNYWQKLKTHAYIMGKSVVSNFERSEKLYESLKMRGFSGKITFKHKKINAFDLVPLILVIFVMVYFIVFIDLEKIFLEVFGLFWLLM